jgi:uncharacterized protein
MWYYVEEGQQTGPVSEEDAQAWYRSGRIGDATLVWREGMTDWVPAGSLPFFASLRTSTTAPPVPPPIAGSYPAAIPDEGALCVLSHVLGLLTGFLGPLVIFLVAKTEPAKAHARRALNWQISLLIYCFVSFVLVFLFIGVLLLLALMIMDLVFCIMAAVKAGKNERWTYPVTIPFLKD